MANPGVRETSQNTARLNLSQSNASGASPKNEHLRWGCRRGQTLGDENNWFAEPEKGIKGCAKILTDREGGKVDLKKGPRYCKKNTRTGNRPKHTYRLCPEGETEIDEEERAEKSLGRRESTGGERSVRLGEEHGSGTADLHERTKRKEPNGASGEG